MPDLKAGYNLIRNGMAASPSRVLTMFETGLLAGKRILITGGGSGLGAATARLFIWPDRGMPAHVSAIVMLNGPGDRLDTALDRRDHGVVAHKFIRIFVARFFKPSNSDDWFEKPVYRVVVPRQISGLAMSLLPVVLVSAVVLSIAYVTYGRVLARLLRVRPDRGDDRAGARGAPCG